MTYLLSKEEMRRRASMLPGYEQDQDERGFKFDTRDGKLWIRNAMPDDEIFESEFYGKLNISEMYRRIGTNIESAVSLPLAGLSQNIALRDISERHAMKLTHSRISVPIIIAFASDGIQVIDGAHRIHRLRKMRKKNVTALIASPLLLRESRVRQYLLDCSGCWRNADTLTDSQFEMELLSGERIAHKVRLLTSM